MGAELLKKLGELQDEVDNLQALNNAYRDCLAWYADRVNYTPNNDLFPCAEIELDKGSRARKVLNGDRWS